MVLLRLCEGSQHIDAVQDAGKIFGTTCWRIYLYTTRIVAVATVDTWRFVTGAKEIIGGGYQKDVPFIVRRFDTDYNILLVKYLHELR
ncbi:hypothetical protein F4775DRAFT_389137 [Biscogniauxia sp. FL1348]|nr:hypothetical protein F4775DRAFT_389137 [Biscogniauxia sp. FL1348]